MISYADYYNQNQPRSSGQPQFRNGLGISYENGAPRRLFSGDSYFASPGGGGYSYQRTVTGREGHYNSPGRTMAPSYDQPSAMQPGFIPQPSYGAAPPAGGMPTGQGMMNNPWSQMMPWWRRMYQRDKRGMPPGHWGYEPPTPTPWYPPTAH